MTREEILEQAKVGGFAVVRARLPSVFYNLEHQITVLDDDGDTVYFHWENIISIEPPPKSDAEKLADALADIERLKAKLETLHKVMNPLSALRTDPSPWRDHYGDEMPCDGVLVVDYISHDGHQASAPAGNLEWKYAVARPCDIILWRPHVEVG